MKPTAKGCDFYSGFKMIRPETETQAAAGDTNESSGGNQDNSDVDETDSAAAVISEPESRKKDEPEEQVLFWFFFPVLTKPGTGVPANVIAWEAASHSGRATYFFRMKAENTEEGAGDIVAAAIQRLNRALVMINFRREPLYLPEESLITQTRYRHYAIACRRLAVLRDMRVAYIGRAIHTSPETWQKQMDELLAKE
jgi:hypothetical protein